MVAASLLAIATSLLFVSFHGFIPKTTTHGISLVAACMAMFFLYAASLSFFLSKNVTGTYVFFESTIASFYQALHCGSPRGTMAL